MRPDPAVRDGQRQKQTGVSENLMVHRVFRSVVEPVEIQGPAVEGDREADFPYLITLPGNRKEAKTFLCREVQDWFGNRRHLRMLVISPIRTAENTKVGDGDCGPESRTDGLLSQCSRKPFISQTIVQREPTRSFVRIVGEKDTTFAESFSSCSTLMGLLTVLSVRPKNESSCSPNESVPRRILCFPRVTARFRYPPM